VGKIEKERRIEWAGWGRWSWVSAQGSLENRKTFLFFSNPSQFTNQIDFKSNLNFERLLLAI
jgi:hypothetical protein